MPSSRTSGRTASCSGAGWTGRFGPGKVQQPRPRPPTCRYRRWGRRMTRRHSSTSSRRPRRHVGGPRLDWPVRLIPLLTGEAQLAAQQLPVQNLLVYDDLKRAILQRVGQEPRAAPPALPFAGAWGERPALRDGSPAPGRLPQMAVGRGRRRRPSHRPGGAGAVYCAAPHEDRAVGLVPPSGVAGPGHPTRRGPDGGVPRGWRNPTVRLSLSPSPARTAPFLSVFCYFER